MGLGAIEHENGCVWPTHAKHTVFDGKHLSIKCNCQWMEREFTLHTIYHSITCLIDLLLMALDQCLNTIAGRTCSIVILCCFCSINGKCTYIVNKLDALSHTYSFFIRHKAKRTYVHYIIKCHFHYFRMAARVEKKALCVPFTILLT